MGMIIDATCGCCGFYQEVYFGGSIDKSVKDIVVPVLDLSDCELLVRWYSEKESMKGKLAYYSDPGLYKGEVTDFRLRSGEIYLSPMNNFCPECNRFTMAFTVTYQYD
jgi:hypothetical protein